MYQVVAALGTETSRPSSAAQVIAGVACAEIPIQQWQDIIPKLVEKVTCSTSEEQAKEASLEAIGYICADMVDHMDCFFVFSLCEETIGFSITYYLNF